MTGVFYKYQIPDINHPIPEEERGLGASGQLIDFKPAPIAPEAVVGRAIDEMKFYVGTYGMGGPGFFGLRLGDEWLVVAIWGAAEWLLADGRCVEDTFYDMHNRPRPWMAYHQDEKFDELTSKVIGQTIASIEVRKQGLTLGLANGLTFEITQDPDTRPVWEGNKEPRAFKPDDDLRKAVFLSPTDEIWI